MGCIGSFRLRALENAYLEIRGRVHSGHTGMSLTTDCEMAELDAAAVFPLHYSVFQGDIKKVAALCRSEDINKKDPHGQLAFISQWSPATLTSRRLLLQFYVLQVTRHFI